jgi:hypothetical protein
MLDSVMDSMTFLLFGVMFRHRYLQKNSVRPESRTPVLPHSKRIWRGCGHHDCIVINAHGIVKSLAQARVTSVDHRQLFD